jgi:hypothetical protein
MLSYNFNIDSFQVKQKYQISNTPESTYCDLHIVNVIVSINSHLISNLKPYIVFFVIFYFY